MFVSVEFEDADVIAEYPYWGKKVDGSPRSLVRLRRGTVVELIASFA